MCSGGARLTTHCDTAYDLWGGLSDPTSTVGVSPPPPAVPSSSTVASGSDDDGKEDGHHRWDEGRRASARTAAIEALPSEILEQVRRYRPWDKAASLNICLLLGTREHILINQDISQTVMGTIVQQSDGWAVCAVAARGGAHAFSLPA